MIAQLSGDVAEKHIDQVIIDCGGVGYGVLVSVEDHGSLQIGERTKLYIYEHIRENSHDLFGFLRLETKLLFEQLLGVNGVGPKMAMSIMSIGSTGAVRSAIASGDTKFITQAGGVGKRVAERVIVDLKDKVGLLSSEDATSFLGHDATLMQGDEAVQALVALGYSVQDAVLALSNIDSELSIEERIRQALKS